MYLRLLIRALLGLAWSQLNSYYPLTRFSVWAIWPSRGPHQVSKGPQEKDGKFGGHSKFCVGHRNFTAWIKYFKFKIESKVSFSSASASAQKAKLYFIAVATSYLVTGVTCLLSEVRHRLDVVKRVDLRLSLTTPQPDIQELASIMAK